MAEKLGFQQIFRQGRAVHGDQRLVRAGAALMQGAGHQLLAGAGFAGDQHSGFSRGHGTDDLKHVLDRLAAAQNARTGRGVGELAAQFAVFHAQAGMFNGLFQRMFKGLEIQGLDQIIIRAQAQGLHSGFHRRIGRHQHHRQRRIIFQNALERVNAVHARHAHIGQHRIKGLFPHPVHGFVAVGGLIHRVAPGPQHGFEHAAVGIVVIDH